MKVLHICNDYYHSTIYRNLHQSLIKQDIDSTMIVPSEINEIDMPFEEKVVQAKSFYRFERFFFFIKYIKVFNFVKKYIVKFKPDVLHAHYVFSAGYVCMKIKKKFNIPYIVAVRNTDVNLYFKYMIHLRKIGLRILLNANKVVFISPSYRDIVMDKYIPKRYKKLIESKTEIISNGIDKFWLDNRKNKEKDIDVENINIITVGAVNKNKNQIAVANAVNLLNSRGYDMTYTIVGKIEDKEVYKELMQYSFVKFIDNCPKEELIHYYQNADIFILTSLTETFGLVYAEALSQGIPIIYSQGQGFDGQFIEGVVGYHTNCFDIESITKVITDIINNYTYLSNNCYENCVKFDWNLISKKYIHIYKNLFNRRIK